MNGGSASGAFYPVERVVASRKRKRHTEYLVLWEGYRREESSWVPEADVTATAKRTFLNPQPPLRIINDSVSNLIISLAASLRLGAIRKCS
ncbi:hypothetical protein EMCRGX_G020490 [Ephydatia muelleri]